jgi:hypothetical protein
LRSGLRRIASAVHEPVILIMIAAGVADLLSGGPLSHTVFLVAGAFVIGWDRGRVRPQAPTTAVVAREGGDLIALARSVPAWLGIAVAAVYAAVVGGFARFTWPISVAVLVPGALAVIAVWRDPSPRPPRPKIDRLGLLAWAAVFVALGLWELTQLLLQPALTINSVAHPTISVLLDPLLNQHRVDRSIGIFLWLAFGWYLVDR